LSARQFAAGKALGTAVALAGGSAVGDVIFGALVGVLPLPHVVAAGRRGWSAASSASGSAGAVAGTSSAVLGMRGPV
jgi:hypothetical protein